MKYNLIELYERAFGHTAVRGVGPLIPIGDATWPIPPYSVETERLVKDYRESMMGTPVMFPLKLDDYDMPNEPLVHVTGNKIIVKTQVAGVQGSVKELVSDDDYMVTIEGLIINEDGDDFPEEISRRIIEICQSPKSLKVQSDFLAMFDIHNLVIENYNFQGVTGNQNVQSYTINALSDRPLTLELKQK